MKVLENLGWAGMVDVARLLDDVVACKAAVQTPVAPGLDVARGVARIESPRTSGRRVLDVGILIEANLLNY